MLIRVVVFSVFALAATTGPIAAQCDDAPPYDATDEELVGSGFGNAVAMSADGTIALVGGTGFDGADGIVRTFEMVNGDWIEGTAYQAGVFAGEGFGWAIAMNNAGDRAAISSPYHWNNDPFVAQAGVVDIWERDAGTGDWGLTHRFWDPSPGFRQGFGASLGMTPDGNTLVIGRAGVLGSETDPLPDAAFITTHDGSNWSGLTELVPSPGPGALDQFGASIAVNDAGDTIAVGAPQGPIGEGNSGDIYIFRDQAGSWTHTETLTRPIPGAVFNMFGGTIAFAGDVLVTSDVFEPDNPGAGQGPPLLLYDGSDGSFGSDPDRTLFVPPSLLPRTFDGGSGHDPGGLGSAIAVRGDTMLVGASGESHALFVGAGGVYRLEREDGEWTFVSRVQADEPSEFAAFGGAVAVSADGSDYVIGEPSYEPSFELFQLGRVHLTGQVFAQNPFSIETAQSSIVLELTFPGVPLQIVELVLHGLFEIAIPGSCEDTDPATQMQLVGATITNGGAPVTLTIAKGVDVVATDLSLTLVRPSQPATISDGGQAILDEARFELAADVQINGSPPYTATGVMDLDEFQVEMTGDSASGHTFGVPEFTINQVIDAGLGDDNPTAFATFNLTANETDPPCGPADLAEPFGTLDLDDVVTFVTLFTAGDQRADLAEPIGLFDLADVLAFVTLFNAGCP